MRRLHGFSIIAALMVMSPIVVHAQTLSAVWDPNPPADQLTGYQVCISTSSMTCNVQQATVPATDTDYTFTPSAGVLYRVAVRGVNAAGAGNYSPEVLTSIPSLTQPANQSSAVDVPISPLSLSATDPDGSTLQFSHTGLPFGLTLNASTGIITGTPTSSGTFNVTAFVFDGLATVSRAFTWTVNTGGSDTTAPTLAITSHTNGQTVSTASITLAGTATDSGAGGSGISSVTVNGTAATGGTATGNNTANWSRSVSLTTGTNTITVVARDGANNTRTTSITITRAAADTTAPTLTITSHTPGQTVTTSSITLAGTATDSGAGGSGITSVTVNGTAAGGGSATGNNTANWSNTVTLANGANVITVVARDGANNARTTPITVIYAAPQLSLSLTPNQPSPQSTGTSVTFTAGASGGTGPYQFKWWLYNGSTWTMVRDWGTATYTWTPTAANANYRVGIWARDATMTTDVATFNLSIPYVITSVSTPLTITGLTSSLPSPRATGTAITFTATATGGTGAYQFKWWVYNGTTWTMVRDWGAATYTWTPTAASANYRVGIWARDATTTADVNNVNASVPYVITGTSTAPVTITGLTSDLSSPRVVGTSITFTATASGGTGSYQFKWWLYNGSTWTMVRDWGAAAYTWTPTASNPNYRVGIWARDATTTADVNNVNFSVPYVITAAAP